MPAKLVTVLFIILALAVLSTLVAGCSGAARADAARVAAERVGAGGSSVRQPRVNPGTPLAREPGHEPIGS